jgi:tRNA A37 threonylcarbamoyladenosine synthetase subunit TsaC/SUA5/YrdC
MTLEVLTLLIFIAVGVGMLFLLRKNTNFDRILVSLLVSVMISGCTYVMLDTAYGENCKVLSENKTYDIASIKSEDSINGYTVVCSDESVYLVGTAVRHKKDIEKSYMADVKTKWGFLKRDSLMMLYLEN